MANKIKDPGVGVSSNKRAKRFVNLDGSFNIKHVNRKVSVSESYSYLINISWSKFFAWVLFGYIILNTFFAIVYLFLGVEAITEPSKNLIIDFFNAFFFSAQTITTVGYGAMAPDGIVFGFISSIEALVGLLCFSFVTGLLYGRFSRPKSNIRFSEHLVLNNKKGEEHSSLMFRLMSKSKHVMIYPKIEVTLALSEKNKEGVYKNNFYKLALERNEITYLPTTWTVVHTIKESSPLYQYSIEELKQLHAELLIVTTYYDESFNQEVHQIHSYILKNVKIHQKFQKAFYYDTEGYTVLDHNKLDQTEKV